MSPQHVAGHVFKGGPTLDNLDDEEPTWTKAFGFHWLWQVRNKVLWLLGLTSKVYKVILKMYTFL